MARGIFGEFPVMLECAVSWQAQYLVKLESVRMSLLVAGAVFLEILEIGGACIFRTKYNPKARKVTSADGRVAD